MLAATAALALAVAACSSGEATTAASSTTSSSRYVATSTTRAPASSVVPLGGAGADVPFTPATTAAPALRTPAGGPCPSAPIDALAPGAANANARSTVTTIAAPTGGDPSAPVAGAGGIGPTTSAPGTAPVATDPTTVLAPLLDDPRVPGAVLGASIWVEGWGEIVGRNADRAMVPASNEKLYTAMAANELLDVGERPRTIVVATGPVNGGVLAGDLVLVGGGDPTLTAANGPDSLAALATQVRAAGITQVDGHLVVDESRYDSERSVPSWADGWWQSVPPLSALTVDRNKVNGVASGPEADPALGAGDVFRAALGQEGVTVSGATGPGVAPDGMVVASVEGPTYDELLTVMLHVSDNLVAELLVKELDHRRTGRPGTTAGGVALIADALAPLCVPLAGTIVDGSGLSHGNLHPAREIRRLLQAARGRPWGNRLLAQLAVAGQPGSLGGRLTGPRTAGNVRAKTGSVSVSRAISGYATTAGGRAVVFSVILNGPALGYGEQVLDAIVTGVASLPG